jgi:periplasmic protein TonB
MGYQALLFCPDEKTARTVTQVLSELDFSVIPCTEPFAAVKKLMGEHFDAVVVDCDNEQNATLLFKSARNAPNNHSSLAVAVVEGQAGVAKAFRIGANLVLTKPVNVEQAKGTLRVARGLLRKSEAAKPATGAATTAARPTASVAAPPKLVPQRAISTTSAGGAAAAVSPSMTASASVPIPTPAQPRVVASVPDEIIENEIDILDEENADAATPSIVTPDIKSAARQPEISSQPTKQSPSSGAFGTGAASAPAPARESKPGVAIESKSSSVVSEPVNPIETVAASDSGSVEETPAPTTSFTLGGTVESGTKPAGGSKKILLAVAAVLLVAAVGYAVWMQWVSSSGAATPFTNVATKPVTTAAKAPPSAPPVAAPAAPLGASSAASPTPDVPDSAVATNKVTANKVKATDAPMKPAATPVTEPPAAKAAPQPIAIKGGSSHPASKGVASADAPAPSLGIAPAENGAALPNLMNSKAATPVLQVVHVSQGVSRGLLVKEVPPQYPVPALQRRAEGAVELQATISKSGDITAVKVLSGDQQLAHAAVEAVKQWKYKPYLLDGEPLEIQTQITVKFQLPH